MMRKGFTLIELLIVVAIIAILAAIAVPNFLEAQVRAKVSRVKADQRSLATALESYYVDTNSYPANDSSTATSNTDIFGQGVNAGLTDPSAALLEMPTLRRKRDGNDRLQTLTTPIAYITSIFIDPFSKTSGASFNYSTPQSTLGVVSSNSGWILWSFGPDVDERDNGINLGGADPVSGTILITGGGDIAVAVGSPPRIETRYYAPGINRVPSATLIDATYDPTNGTTSQGDVWRVKQ